MAYSRAQMLRQIEQDDSLSGLMNELKSGQNAQRPDPGHDLSHCLRVAIWTLEIGGALVNVREAIAAALLHDVVNVPKDSPDRARASQLCSDQARLILSRHGFSAEAIERIAGAILDHSYSRGARPTSPLGCALQDADRLEGLGAIGIFRLISTGTLMNANYFDPEDPWAKNRELNDRKFALDHFFTKLLKLPETMTTEVGCAEAKRRAQVMKTFLAALGLELGEAAAAALL